MILLPLLLLVAQGPIAGMVVGPESSIVCPAGAVAIVAPQSIPDAVDKAPAGTTFCVKASTHWPTRPTYLKAGDKLIGEFGAVINCTDVTQSYDTGGINCISGHNCTACVNVTVRNLVVKNLPMDKAACIGWFPNLDPNSVSYWEVDHNEVANCPQGITAGGGGSGRITANYIHDNLMPYGSYLGRDQLWEGNFFDNNGAGSTTHTEAKWSITKRITVRGNVVRRAHHGAAFWFDGENVDYLVENNDLDGVDWTGIMLEISGNGVVRNNTVKNVVGGHGVFISTSHDVEVYGNTMVNVFRGLQTFLNCDAVGYMYPGQSIEFDLRNNNIHDNTVNLGTLAGSYTSLFSFTGAACTQAFLAPYLDNTKQNTFTGNHYIVPNVAAPVFMWENRGGNLTWNQWRALPQDANGSISLITTTAPGPAPISKGRVLR